MTRTSTLNVLIFLLSASGCAPWESVARVPFGSAARHLDPVPACRLASARSFAIVLRNLDIDAVLAADPDVLVIDWVTGHNACGELDAGQVALLRSRPGHPRGDRLILARVDIGRPDAWRVVSQPPAPDGSCVPSVMLPVKAGSGMENAPAPDDPAWRSALCDGPESVVGRISALGFDGIYVEGLVSGVAALQPDQAASIKMGGVFRAVAAAARERAPGMVVVAAEPGGHLESPGFLDAVTAVAFHGAMFRDGYVLPTADLAPVLARLNAVRAAGVPVIAVEFIDDAVQESHFLTICRRYGYLCYSGVPDFNHLEPLIDAGNGVACGASTALP